MNKNSSNHKEQYDNKKNIQGVEKQTSDSDVDSKASQNNSSHQPQAGKTNGKPSNNTAKPGTQGLNNNNGKKNNGKGNGKPGNSGKPNNSKSNSKPNNKKISNGTSSEDGNSHGTQDTYNKHGEGDSVKNTGDGSQVSSPNFDDKSKLGSGVTDVGTGVAEKTLAVESYRTSDTEVFSLVDYDRMDGNTFNPSTFNNTLINYSRATGDTYRLKDTMGLKKVEKVYTLPTVGLRIQQEEYDLNRDYFMQYLQNPITNPGGKHSMGLFINTINLVLGFNIHALGHIYNPFLKNVKVINDGFVTTFTYETDNEVAVSYLGETKSLKDNSLRTSEAIKAGKGRRHLINGYDPESGIDDQVDYKPVDLKVEFNNYQIKKLGANEVINDNLVTDVGTWRIVKSDQQFIQNFINAVLNMPEMSIYAGLTKHAQVILHSHNIVVGLGTIGRILLRIITNMVNNTIFLNKKLGLFDVTAKHFLNAPAMISMRSNIQRFANLISLYPFNKKKVDDFFKYGEHGMLTPDDHYSIRNPYINVSFGILGNFKHFTYNENPWETVTVRDHAAAPSIVLPIGDPLKLLISGKSKNYIKPSCGYYNGTSYSDTNTQVYLDLKGSLTEEAVQKDLDDVTHMFILNPYRLTAAHYNRFRDLFSNSSFLDKFEEWTRSITLFLNVYSSKDILSMTDYAIDTMGTINFTEIKEVTPNVFKFSKLLTTLGLGTHVPQIELLKPDQLQEPDHIPRWFIYPELGSKQVNYQNFVGYLITSKSMDKTKVDDYKYSKTKFIEDAEIKVHTKLYGVNLLDSTITPIIPDVKHIYLGWNDGVIAHGERYAFDDGAFDSANYLSWVPSCFEMTIPGHSSTTEANLQVSVSLPANDPLGGYFTFQTLLPILKDAKTFKGKFDTLYYGNNLNHIPRHWFSYDDSVYRSLFTARTVWPISVIQEFRHHAFRGLSSMAGSIPYNELPTLEQCALDYDKTKAAKN